MRSVSSVRRLLKTLSHPSTTKRFAESEGGAASLVSVLFLPVLMGFGALSVDVGYVYSLRANAQNAVDLAALGAMVQLRDASTPLSIAEANKTLKAVVIKYANENLRHNPEDLAVSENDITFGTWDFKTQTMSTDNQYTFADAVVVEARFDAKRGNQIRTILSKYVYDFFEFSVKSTSVLSKPPTIHALAESRGMSIVDTDIDTHTILVNAASRNAVTFGPPVNFGTFGMHRFDVVGDTNYRGSRSKGHLTTGVNAKADFFTDVPEPDVPRHCDYTRTVINSPGKNVVLRPGVYCEGILLEHAKEVRFMPGTYIIRGGHFETTGGMRGKLIWGADVLFYYVGSGSKNRSPYSRAEVQLNYGRFVFQAKQHGPHAGIVFFMARGKNAPRSFHAVSAILEFRGAIYAPDTTVLFYESILNGACHVICLVAERINFSDTFVNYYPNKKNMTKVPVGHRDKIVSPPGLSRSFRPYIVEQQSPPTT